MGGLSDAVAKGERVILHLRSGFWIWEYFTTVTSVDSRAMTLAPVMIGDTPLEADSDSADILDSMGSPICTGVPVSTFMSRGRRFYTVHVRDGSIPQGDDRRKARRYVTHEYCTVNGRGGWLADIGAGGFAFITKAGFSEGDKVELACRECNVTGTVVRTSYGSAGDRMYGCRVDSPTPSFRTMVAAEALRLEERMAYDEAAGRKEQ